LTRLGLFVQTITQFLEALRKEHPRLCGKLPQDLRERYLDREGYFADARGSDAPRRLGQAALDAFHLVRWYEDHKQVRPMESYQLLKRLFDEQCEPPKSRKTKRIALKEKPSSSSLQSPFDPDVTYGHKGKGYEVQLVETCDAENGFQVITSVDVHGANESDQHQVEPALDQIERTCGQTPEELINDTGYGSGDNIVAARERGTELLAPISSKESEKYFSLTDFELDEAGEQILKCPAGHEPIRHEPTRNGKGTQAIFEKARCDQCPLRHTCPAEKRREEWVLRFTAADVAVARRRVEQETTEFKERYKIRSGIEATNSELKRCHGLSKLRVRRQPRVALSVRLKVLALNVKRYVGHLTEAAAPMAPAAACAC